MQLVSFLVVGNCREHFNKLIFREAEHATLYAKHMFLDYDVGAYRCPVDPRHYHYYNKKKRMKKSKQNHRRNVRERKKAEWEAKQRPES